MLAISVVTLFVAVLLIYDGITAVLGWRGLRITTTPALIPFLLAAAAMGVTAYGAGPARLTAFVGGGVAILAIPVYLAVAALRTRSFRPDEWAEAGDYGWYDVNRIDLPAAQGSIPALLYMPGSDARGAIVLIHGAGAHKTFYTWPIVDILLQANFAVCAIDLDGHGANQRVLDYPSVLEDVEAAVIWLQPRWNFVGVCGISLGGCVAARSAAEGVAVDAIALFEAPIRVEYNQRVRRHEYWTLARHGAWALHRYAGTLPIVRSWATQPTRTRIGTFELIEKLDLLQSLRDLRVPCWLCYGASDWVVPLWQVERIKNVMPAGATLRVVPRATHLSLPLDPKSLRALAAWLSKIRQQKEAWLGTEMASPAEPAAVLDR